MLAKGFPEKTFSFLVIALLFVELLTPFAYAADANPQNAQPAVTSDIQYPTGFVGSEACTTNSITPQERQTLYDNTIGKPIEQLTDLPLESALQSSQTPVQNPLSPDAPLNPFIESSANPLEQKISLASLAALMGVDKRELVEKYVSDFDPEKDNVDEVAENTLVSMAQAQAIARDKGGTAQQRVDEIINKYLGIGGSQTSTLPTPSPEPYANLKIILPGSPGRELTYNQIAAAQPLDPKSCLLNGEIKGKVSYLGLLGSDLTYAIPNNETQSGQYVYAPSGKVESDLVDPNSNQWLVGSPIAAYLSLNGGANILVPSFYEDWLAFSDKWTEFDLFASLSLSVAGTAAAANLEKMIAGKKELAQNIMQTRIQQTALQGQLFEELQGDIITKTIGGRSGQIYAGSGGKFLVEKEIVGGQTNVIMHELDASGNVLTGRDVVETIAPTRGFDTIVGEQGLSPVTKPGTGLNPAVKTGLGSQANWNRLKAQALPRVSYSLMMGAGWMGMARLAYDIADRNLFDASGFNDPQYLKVFVGKEAGKKFREATSILALGHVQEIIARYTGSQLTAPAKAFSVGNVFLGNYQADAPGGEDRASTTLLSSFPSWTIKTVWKGDSLAVNFEDVRNPGTETYTSLPLLTNKIVAKPIINSKTGGAAYSYLLTLSLPFLVFKGLAAGAGTTLGVAGALLVAEKVFAVDPNYGAGKDCDKNQLDEFKTQYRTSIVAGYVTIIALTLAPLLSASAIPLLSQTAFAARILGDVNAWTNPLLAWQWWIGNTAQIYAANCKDPQYKIFSYQKIPEATVNQNQTASSQATDLLQNFIDTAKGENQVTNELAKYTEILNLKTSLTDQNGFVSPTQLFAIHIEKSSWMMPKGLFDSLNESSCFLQENNPTSDGGIISISKGGLKKVNKDGSVAFDFNSFYWKLRAASILRSQELARMIVPNTVITTPLDCGTTPFVSINAGGLGTIVNKACPSAICLTGELKKLIPTFDGADLSMAIGKISSVDTTLGTTTFSGNSISFTRTSVGETGIETRAPSLDYLANQSGLGKSTVGTSLVILGNASVVLNGPSGDFSGMDVGELKTIIGDKGKIEYDPYAKKLYVFVYVLADGEAQTIGGISGTIGTIPNPQTGGEPIPVVNLALQPKRGYEDLVAQLNAALKQIQSPDNGRTPGGFQVLETPDKIIYMTPDGKLKIFDKNTGEVQTFDLTGTPYRDANGNIVFPTDQGLVTIGTGVNDKGQPIINIMGPGGLSSEGALEAAKGPGGIFTFNPSTGAITVYNGQDLPMDPRFSSQGLGFVGSNGGTVGIPADNPFSLPPAPSDAGLQRNTSLILPAWPEQPFWFAAMLLLVLVGVIAVRTTRFE